MVDVLRLRVEQDAARRAFTYLHDGEEQAEHWDYAELDRGARSLAVAIREHCRPGDRVLMLHPSGLEYVRSFFACLYAGVIGVPLFPPRLIATLLPRDLRRIRIITADCDPPLVLTTSMVLDAAEALLPEVPELAQKKWLATDRVTHEGADAWRAPELKPETIAFLQYTSGSTSDPKGVMVSHGNLIVNEQMIAHGAGYTRDSVMVSWLPLFHDLGLIGAVLQPCFTGFLCVMMSPEAFLHRPMRWMRAITKYGGTAGGGPNFAYELCVRKAKPADLEGIDLSTWTSAYNGGEPIRVETLERFVEKFGTCGFRRESFFPVYGLAEATVYVAGGPRPGPAAVKRLDVAALGQGRAVEAPPGTKSRDVVGSTRSQIYQQVAIVDPETRRRTGPGEIGEIWLSGPHIAQGYWEQPEESEKTFRARLADGGDGAWLRTGDLGFVEGEEIYLTGRRKNVIIIEGRNHHAHDLEYTAEGAHPLIRAGCSAAFVLEQENGGERVGMALEVRPERQVGDLPEIARAVQQAVALEHEIRLGVVILMESGTVPKTSSGKIQRQACRKLFYEGKLESLATFAGPLG